MKNREYIIVTGGLGFIGSSLVDELVLRFNYHIIVVDNLNSNFNKINNCKFNEYIYKGSFIDQLQNIEIHQIKCIIHLGACSNTTEMDRQYLMSNNFEYTKSIIDFCLRHNIKLIYASSASVYGNSEKFIEDSDLPPPINYYAESKLEIDKYVQSISNNNIIGLRFFNVYGVKEKHKLMMASVPYQLATGELQFLFANGEHARDFIYIQDVITIIINCINSDVSGIFNVGTGKARTFNDIKSILNLDIPYVEIPNRLINKYQVYTCANIDKLKSYGLAPDSFISLESGILDMTSKLI